MASSWLSAQWQILGVFSHSIVSYSYCPPNSGYPECSVGGMTIRLPNGIFQYAVYWLSGDVLH